ncbi:hypothetical protein [Chitinophaga vietnamensis]|uniref:hypothetical protein n=1 Tax=Chitinophaga vietnamensis TaxID=2593957 RepID=UPI0011775B97|nr:hypothetical protein [Chitinophaga vietnamensis]
MQLRSEILKEFSREQSLRIAAWIGNDPQRFAALMQLFLHDEYRVVQRAARIVNFVAEAHPALVAPYLPEMAAMLGTPGLTPAVTRNIVRLFQFMPIPETVHGTLMNACFQFLEAPESPTAVKAFSMTVLSRLAKDYPDIRNEIILLIEDQLEHNPSAGFRSRAKKVLKEISQ